MARESKGSKPPDPKEIKKLQKLKKQLKTGQVQIASDLKKLKKNLSKGDWARVVKTLKEGVRKGAKKAPKEINANAYIRDADKFIDKIK